MKQTNMKQTKSKKSNFLLRIIQGALIGLGAVLPGISGGVLCVIFGIYKTIMEFLADPFRKLRTHLPLLIPIGIGGVIGFLGVANVLSFLLEKYPDPSVCLFVGLIGGMLPSLFREAGEQGRNKASYVSMQAFTTACLILWLLLTIASFSFNYGLLPSAIVLLLWAIQQIAYFIACLKSGKSTLEKH
jgi:putative membrane protein